MHPPLTIIAEMRDGSVLVEHAPDFSAFVALVLPFKADSECVRVTWHQTPALALRQLRRKAVA